jgi:hypothetical protein
VLLRWFLPQIIYSTLKMEAVCYSETSVDTQRTTRHYIQENCTFHNHRCENLKPYITLKRLHSRVTQLSLLPRWEEKEEERKEKGKIPLLPLFLTRGSRNIFPTSSQDHLVARIIFIASFHSPFCTLFVSIRSSIRPITLSPPTRTLTLKMASTRFAETLENPQH